MTKTAITAKGMDVYVGDGTIDWKKVGDSGISFAMIKATQGHLISDPNSGRVTDSAFEYNIKCAYDNGLYCGAYHYLMAKSVKEAESEANFFISKILPYKDKIKLFAGVDMENDSAKTYKSSEKKLNTDILISFCDTVERSGFKSIIYVNPNFIKNYLEFDRLKGRSIWLAYWTGEETALNYINKTSDPSQFKLWQYGDATINGVKKKTDGDMALFDLTANDSDPVLSIELPDSTDLNRCLTPGNYYSAEGNCKNVPDDCESKAFLLNVANGADGTKGFCLQTLYVIESGKEYRRGIYTKNGGFDKIQLNWR